MGQIDIAAALVTYFGFLVALTLREAARAYMGKYLGDHSIETQSRATINPLPHIDPLGTVVFPIVMLITGVPFLLGWAKPVLIDSRYFKKMKRDINLVAMSGIAFNFIMAFVCAVILRGMDVGADVFQTRDPLPAILFSVAKANMVIGIFNLIPFPQSDGWRILINTVNYNLAQKLQENSGVISLVMIGLLFFTGIFNPIFSFFLSMLAAFILV